MTRRKLKFERGQMWKVADTSGGVLSNPAAYVVIGSARHGQRGNEFRPCFRYITVWILCNPHSGFVETFDEYGEPVGEWAWLKVVGRSRAKNLGYTD